MNGNCVLQVIKVRHYIIYAEKYGAPKIILGQPSMLYLRLDLGGVSVIFPAGNKNCSHVLLIHSLLRRMD